MHGRFVEETENNQPTPEELAAFLKTTPEALAAFEDAYAMATIDDLNGKARFDVTGKMDDWRVNRIIDRICDEFAAIVGHKRLPGDTVAPEDIASLPPELRPQCTATLMQRDIDADSGATLVGLYRRAVETVDPSLSKQFYHLFRQGLDILDLDPLTCAMIDTNPNSMEKWLPALEEALAEQSFFKMPTTKVVRMPMSILQLARTDYNLLTPTTKAVVNRVVFDFFDLDENKSYFVKTGTYSSKYDFRNCVVRGAEEVRELGEYLLWIHHQAIQMASPLNGGPSIYGVSTTNEWVVREYIEDVEDNPCIYHGMPLHTEYRAFVDLDTDQVLAVVPYWDPETMKDRFSKHADADTPDMRHDYVVYMAHEDTLMARYNENKHLVVEHLGGLVTDIDLKGQWSIDIMQNGDDFYVIDMALAEHSAFYDHVPTALRSPLKENWMPQLPA